MIQLTINGETHSFEGDGDMPLLWYLRDLLNLTGTKYSCGIGTCGACTVHIDGEAVRSCMLPVGTLAASSRVVTIEGLSPDGSHPLQRAWAELDVPQCGYCQPGMIMAVAALLDRNPQPTDADINDAMSGNICRCGTYTRIRKAIQRAAGGES